MFTMEMMKKQTYVANTAPSALAIRRDSQVISKAKPQVRIIHIVAPEIIKTDVANFRELVQRLTGKPTEDNTKKKQRIPRKELPGGKIEMRSRFRSTEFRERIKGEEEIMWGGENQSAGGFLNGFGDLDGFMKELNEFPLFPSDSNSHTDALGGTKLA